MQFRASDPTERQYHVTITQLKYGEQRKHLLLSSFLGNFDGSRESLCLALVAFSATSAAHVVHRDDGTGLNI